KSFSTDTLMNWLMNIVCTNTQINLLTKDDTLRRQNIERIKNIMSILPPYLNQRTKADTNNGEEITVNRLKNKYITHVPQSSEKGAYKLGRGLTSPVFHIDEPPFQQHIKIALGSALAAGTNAVDRAKKVNAPYGTIITTTAGKKDDRDGSYVFGLLQEAAPWNETYFDCKNQAELEKVIRRNSRTSKKNPNGVYRVNITFNHIQLGKTDEWLMEKLEAAVQEGEDADRDYFNRWTSGSDSHPLPIHQLETIRNSVREPMWLQVHPIHGYALRWYLPEAQVEPYMQSESTILTLDPSEMGGGDDLSFYLMDLKHLSTLAAGTFNESNILEFCKWLLNFLVTNKKVTCVIERRSSGAFILDYLCVMLPSFGENPFKRLYNRVVHEYDEKIERYREIQQPMSRYPKDIYTKHKTCFGFATSGTGQNSRSELYSIILRQAAGRSGGKVFDKVTADQILGLTTRNNRIDHAPGEHDDMVIAWLLAHWFVSMGKNLSFYGIDSREINVRATMVEEMTVEDKIAFRKKLYQKQLRQAIESIVEKMKATKDVYVMQRYEQELRHLDSKIEVEEGEAYSLDSILESVKQKKHERRVSNGFSQPAQVRNMSYQTMFM
ncbi:MAG: hypothetical protein NTZ16_16430, partial [Verrucomicrobia bacterium]|nr:hypothetical protein [Verrucomicrobiota bacterium]